MDLTLICSDDPTRPLAGSHNEVLDVLSLSEETLSAYERGTEIVSDLPEPADKSAELLSSISQSRSLERSAKSDCVMPLSFGFNVPERLSVCSAAAPKDEDFGVDGSCDSSDPVSHLSHDLIPPSCDIYTENKLTLLEANTSPKPFRAMSANQTLGHTVHLLRSLSHRSDSLESDTAAAPVTDLYIFESDTQDFILSPAIESQEIKCPEYTSLSQTEGKDAGHGMSWCQQSCISEWPVTTGESDSRGPPAADACEAGLMSVNDVRQERAEVNGLTPQGRRSDSPVDLWLDACQYLTGEDADNGDVLDKTVRSVTQTGLAASIGETQASGYNPEGSDGIGWSNDDTIGWGPPVERWSSVDSWASALSDWAGIIAAPPEDFTAAFTEIGAEIDALTQALAGVNTDTGTSEKASAQTQSHSAMGVQDQPLEAQSNPEGSILSGQSCLAEAAGPELASTSTESLCDSTATMLEEKEVQEVHSSQPKCSPCPSHQHSSMGSTGAIILASHGGYNDATLLVPGCTSSADSDLSDFDQYVQCLERDIFTNTEDIVLNIVEDSDLTGGDAPVELKSNRPSKDGVCQVTEEASVSQPGLAAAQAAKQSCGPAKTDCDGTEAHWDPRFLAAQILTSSHVAGVNAQPGRHINVPTHVSPNTLADLDGACQVGPQSGSPKFIMPLAPLNIGPSLNFWTSRSLEGDQSCAKRSLNDNRDFTGDRIVPAYDGITVTPSLEIDKQLIHKKENTSDSDSNSSSEEQKAASGVLGESETTTEETTDLSEQSNLCVAYGDHCTVSESNRVAVITLDVDDPFVSRAAKPKATPSKKSELNRKTAEKMPHKTHKTTSESKTRSKKDKSAVHHHPAQASKKQENLSQQVPAQQTCRQKEILPGENKDTAVGPEEKQDKLVIETGVMAEKAKPHGKKKKKHGQNATLAKNAGEPLAEIENGARPKSAKGRIDMFEAKLEAKAQKDGEPSDAAEKKQPEAKLPKAEQAPNHTEQRDPQPKKSPSPLKDDAIKRRRLSEDKFGKLVSALESKMPKPDAPKAEVGAARRKAYSEVVKQKTSPPKEDLKVVQPIQPISVSGDPQSLCLWCQFTAVFCDHAVTWRRDGAALSEIKRSAGDESRVSLTISNASHKDLGKYQCCLNSSHGSLTLDYVLTYEVLSEIVIPQTPKTVTAAPVAGGSEEEDVQCSGLIFKDDFLSGQFFGENHLIRIITEKAHFGEGMHRRAFRTKLHTGQVQDRLQPGHSCVLKVHNAISYGTNNNEELIQKNFTLAVEECQVQNTAREYIKAYTDVAQSVEAFGDVPEIIPIYLIHRPSNDIPYATLEEELIGDFVKYSVKDGKEINLMRRDSEAGRKCCAFQHWVYHKTEGNLLVTDMQGVGMKLTDVGIATCKKGYKGFKGNCATSFIDQFKALHQCNTYCEIMGLKSLQPKPKKPAPKAKPQPAGALAAAAAAAAPKKKIFGPTLKGKS